MVSQLDIRYYSRRAGACYAALCEPDKSLCGSDGRHFLHHHRGAQCGGADIEIAKKESKCKIIGAVALRFFCMFF